MLLVETTVFLIWYKHSVYILYVICKAAVKYASERW